MPTLSCEEIRFVFYHDGVTMCHGGDPLIKGIPALLLLHMLRNYRSTGKTVFFLGELREAERTFGSGANLEARLARLAARLGDRVPGVRLRQRRGFRILETERRMILEEL
jgi:hypothetical protein